MPSAAAGQYKQLLGRSLVFRKQAARLSKTSSNRQILLHASLATSVAAWDQYVRLICSEVLAAIYRPGDSGYQSLHTRMLLQLDNRLLKFNTPNFENSRNLLLESTGFDPYPHWTWPKRGWPVVAVQDRLNEILKVRHSFAHGSTMPKYLWNTDPLGNVALSGPTIIGVSGLLSNLVNATDKGFKIHLVTTFGVKTGW